MTSLTRDEVAKIARLARLALTNEELDHYGEQLSAVLDYAARLNEIDLTGVSPAVGADIAHVARRNVMRDDVVAPSLSREDALFNAAATADGQFLIQSILED
ncbi:MAG TPA: Asp-tRNA(Asn)/Glu-tRNA(Gln) amidotransferase subunit GatC [Promineifilum sp.]|nr:Asp-tRNA(Asn)/Glu-tRNA(Gln) amidotransferase subunit GatC [Promineifilum sp.]